LLKHSLFSEGFRSCVRDVAVGVRADSAEVHELRARLASGARNVLRTTPLHALKVGRCAVHNADEGDDDRRILERGGQRGGRGDVGGHGRKQAAGVPIVLSYRIIELLGRTGGELYADIAWATQKRAGDVAACSTVKP
jgi:hypothetical protein